MGLLDSVGAIYAMAFAPLSTASITSLRMAHDVETSDGRIVIIDDDPPVLDTYLRLLRGSGFTVESFSSPMDFLRQWPPWHISCLVVDLALPELTGLEIQALLAGRGISVPMIFISGLADIRACARAMRAGAIDFLVKPIESAQLLEAVARAVARDHEARRRAREQETLRAHLALLTPRERQVCELVATGQINRETAAVLGISEKMVKVHRARALRKLQVDSVAALVRIIDRASG